LTSLRAAAEAYLRRWATADLAPGVDAMMRAYRETGIAPRLDTPAAVAGYVAYRMPGTHAAGLAALSAAAAGVPDLRPVTALDLGGGTGALAWAMAEVFASLRRIRVVDGAGPALEAGRALAASAPWPALSEASWETRDLRGSGLGGAWLEGPVDLVTAGYVLGELGPVEREAAVDLMGEHATTAVIVEPGTPAGFEHIRTARHRLVAAGMNVAAPCPHDDQCPMAGDWCHFSARFERSAMLRRLKRAEHGHDDEKFSYLAATRLPVDRAPARVIRHPRYRKGLVGLELCTGEDGLVGVSITRRSGGRYRDAREVAWGEAWDG
jgi:ribosomal protein RSM22 (predicted rRNA methylase)